MKTFLQRVGLILVYPAVFLSNSKDRKEAIKEWKAFWRACPVDWW